ncbi:PH domain-containing protein [Roseiflexus sp.]|uniref:PH domain-containing protein n=1 Tax=Roseiflexus sp. TaxID=2562120 RepID=UPI002585639F|nr:PH domain-containing protein [Roseiflexus sp.]
MAAKVAGGIMSAGWTVYNDESQYRRIVAYLMPGETLYAVYDCKGVGTGFVDITDRRVMFYDQGMLAKKRAMVSIPYQNIAAIAVAGGDLSKRRNYPADGIRSVCLRVSRSRQSRLGLPVHFGADYGAKAAASVNRIRTMTWHTNDR